MIEWKVSVAEATPSELEALDRFWTAGFGRAVGFRYTDNTVHIKSTDAGSYSRPKSRREIAGRILKAMNESGGS